MPPRVQLDGGEWIDSFAMAIARAAGVSFDSTPGRDSTVGYGVFIPTTRFQQHHRVLRAGDVMTSAEARQGLEQRIVLIGGAWSQSARGRGEPADAHATPVGVIPGVYAHASYAEVLLGQRRYAHTPEWIGVLLEVLLVLAAALAFAAEVRARWKLVIIVLSCGFLGFVAYIAYQNLGLIFEPVIPAIVIGGHALLHQVLDWARAATLYRALPEDVREQARRRKAAEVSRT